MYLEELMGKGFGMAVTILLVLMFFLGVGYLIGKGGDGD